MIYGGIFSILFKTVDFLSEPACHVVDNYIKDAVNEPAIGAIVYCDLAYFAEHSGIYVGNNKIVHLDGSGRVEIASPKIFKKRLNGFNPVLSIYTSCIDSIPKGDHAASQWALDKVGTYISYDALSNNCHMFTASCIKKSMVDSDYAYLSSIKNLSWDKYGVKHWRVWKTQ